jgi:hypothetical protein
MGISESRLLAELPGASSHLIGRKSIHFVFSSRAFAKPVEAFADELKPTTQNLKPINKSFDSSLDQAQEGLVDRF